MDGYEGFAGRIDVRHLVTWAAAVVPALVVPQRFSSRVVAARVRTLTKRNPGLIPGLAGRMQQYLGPPPPGVDYAAEAAAFQYRLAELQWGRVRDVLGRRWPIETHVEGIDHLLRARDSGSGVILWHMGFGGTGTLPTKIGLARAGMELVQLSRAQHGIGRGSWVAVEVIGPLYTRTEDRYLSERVTIPLDDSLGYMRVLIDRLKNNAVVIVMGEERGRRMVTVPFLNGSRPFANGAPALAHKLGAVLLPVHATRSGELAYRVSIGTPIGADRSLLPRSAFTGASIAEFADRLGEHIRAHPSDWDGWIRNRPPADLKDPV